MGRFLFRVKRFVGVVMFNALLSIVVKPRVSNTDETLEKLIETGVSISRFGDGEFKIIHGECLSFQENEPKLQERLREILVSRLDNHVVGIPNVFGSLERFTDKSKAHWKGYLRDNRSAIYRLLDFQIRYYDSLITRLYIDYRDKSQAEKRFYKVRGLWNNRDVIVVEGEQSRLGVGNDLLSNAKSVERILCPAKNAFSKYEEIFNEVAKHDKTKLVLIALGPTATVLAYDLSMFGFQALDIGHIDIEYEWFLRKAADKSLVKNKYVNEVPLGDRVEQVHDGQYAREVIKRIVI